MKTIFYPAIILWVFMLNLTVSAQSNYTLFNKVDSPQTPGVMAVGARQYIQVNPQLFQLNALETGDALSFSWEQQAYTFTVVKVEQYFEDTYSVVSRQGENYLVVTFHDDKMIGTLHLTETGSEAIIGYDPERQQSYLVKPGLNDELKCQFDAFQNQIKQQIGKDVQTQRIYNVMDVKQRMQTQAAQTTIDVLLVYSIGAKTWMEANGGVNSVISQMMTLSQNALDVSNTEITVNLVHTEHVAYDETGVASGSILSALRSTTDGIMDNVHTLRDTHQADLVAILVQVSDTGGIAYLTGDPVNGTPSSAFSLTRVQQATWTYTFIHELGHNMGNMHSRNQSSQAAGVDGGVFPYSTGWRWIGSNGTSYASVMTYENSPLDGVNSIRTPHFSNPSINYQGVPTGSYTGTYAPADNARSMREMKSVIAGYRPVTTNTNPAPIISSLSPTSGNRGTRVTIEFLGQYFLSNLGVSWTCGSSMSFVTGVIYSASRLTITYDITANATLGGCSIYFRNPDPTTGNSNSVVFTINEAATAPTVTTTAVSSITASSASTGGEVTSQGSASVTARGVCYATTTNPTTSNTCVSSGSGTGSFSASLTGLSASTTYYVRAYATNSVGTSYGSNVSFTTSASSAAPTVTTSAVSSITASSASTGGEVTSQGSASVTARGVCYATTTNPTTSNTCVSSGSGTGSFSASLTGLSASTTYYVRAYATNSVGTSYGSNVSFTTSATQNPVPTITSITPSSGVQGSTGITITVTGTNFMAGGSISISGTGVTFTAAYLISSTQINATLDISASAALGAREITIINPAPGGGTSNAATFSVTQAASNPTVTTAAVSSITSTSASSGGNVTSEGSASVTARGVCYATTSNPTTSNSCVSSGSGAGSFTASLTGLTPSTTYYARAYATNSVGTSYGSNVSFTTSAQARPILKPISSSNTVTVNQAFRIDVEIGSGNEVQNLYGIAFKLRSLASSVTYVDGSAARGAFLGNSILEFFRKVNDQTVEVSVSKTSAPGVSGRGVLASANFISSQTGSVTFEIYDVTANDPNGQPIPVSLENLSLSVTAGSQLCVYPGDTNNDSAIDGSDLIPIGLFYGQSLGQSNTPGVTMQCQLRSPWPVDSGTPRRVYADANGDGTINASDVLAIGLNYGKSRSSAPLAKSITSEGLPQPEGAPLNVRLLHEWITPERLRLEWFGESSQAMLGLHTALHFDKVLMERVSGARLMANGSVLGSQVLSYLRANATNNGYDLSLVKTDGIAVSQPGLLYSLELDLDQSPRQPMLVSLAGLEWINGEGRWFRSNSQPMAFTIQAPLRQKDESNTSQDVLESNYPNPFNPVTQIRYRLADDTRVRLEVYTLTGTLVQVLVDRFQGKGSYTVDFDGSQLSSGVYLYRLQTLNSIMTHKMVLLK